MSDEKTDDLNTQNTVSLYAELEKLVFQNEIKNFISMKFHSFPLASRNKLLFSFRLLLPWNVQEERNRHFRTKREESRSSVRLRALQACVFASPIVFASTTFPSTNEFF